MRAGRRDRANETGVASPIGAECRQTCGSPPCEFPPKRGDGTPYRYDREVENDNQCG